MMNKYKNKNDCFERNEESDRAGGTKRQKIVPLVPKGVDCPVSRNPTPTLLESVEDGELSD